MRHNQIYEYLLIIINTRYMKIYSIVSVRTVECLQNNRCGNSEFKSGIACNIVELFNVSFCHSCFSNVLFRVLVVFHCGVTENATVCGEGECMCCFPQGMSQTALTQPQGL